MILKKNPSETWNHPPTSIVISDFWNLFFFAQPLGQQIQYQRFHGAKILGKANLSGAHNIMLPRQNKSIWQCYICLEFRVVIGRKEGNLYFGKYTYNVIFTNYNTILSAWETITKTAMRSLS